MNNTDATDDQERGKRVREALIADRYSEISDLIAETDAPGASQGWRFAIEMVDRNLSLVPTAELAAMEEELERLRECMARYDRMHSALAGVAEDLRMHKSRLLGIPGAMPRFEACAAALQEFWMPYTNKDTKGPSE